LTITGNEDQWHAKIKSFGCVFFNDIVVAIGTCMGTSSCLPDIRRASPQASNKVSDKQWGANGADNRSVAMQHARWNPAKITKTVWTGFGSNILHAFDTRQAFGTA